MRYGLMVLVVLMMQGCATNLVDNQHEKLMDYGMSNSKKVEIKNSETSKTFVTITYLNPINHELVTQESEKFIVGTYMATGDGSFEKTTLSHFKINGSDANITVTPLSQDAPVLGLISSLNAWTNYVLVQAPKTEQVKMEFSFESGPSKRVTTKFQKDY